MTLPDFETIKILGTALTGVKTIADIANTISNAQVRTDLNGKIAELQTAIFNARQQSLEMQEKFEAIVKENRDLKSQLAKKNSEVFMHGVYWLTSTHLDKERSEEQDAEYYYTSYDGPYCPLCKETRGLLVHLNKDKVQIASNGWPVWVCPNDNNEYEAPIMNG